MVSSFFIVTLRRLWRNKASTLVHITGLSLGIASSVIIAALLVYEMGFDAHHPKGDRLYRVVTDEQRLDGGLTLSGASVGAMEEALLKDVTGVDRATTVFIDVAGLFSVERDGGVEKFEVDQGVVRAMPGFFEMFDIRPLEGSLQGLNEPNTVVLAQGIAQRFFGDENPIGRTIVQDNDRILKVVAVVPDPPEQSHVGFTIFRTGSQLREEDAWMYDWGNLSTNVQTFVLLHAGVSAGDVERQTEKFLDLYMKDEINKKRFHLQRVRDIHFEPDYADGIGRTAGSETLSSLAIIGVFLIVTACVNFINMATAQATNRAREVGVRKVLGAAPASISRQYLGETFVTVLLSLLIALIVVEAAFPALTRQLGIEAEFRPFDPVIVSFVSILLVTMTLLSGLYPAFVLRGFMPASALKRSVSTGGRILRKSLVILQFSIAQLLLAALIIVTSQMSFLRDRDMGLEPEGVVTVPLPNREEARLSALRNTLLSRTGIVDVSYSWSSAISGNVWDSNLRFNDGKEEKILPTDLKFADDHYLDVYGLELLAGRNCSPSDTLREFVINETLARSMGFTQPGDAVGHTLKFGPSRPPYPVVGVVRDFNQTSLHTPIRPTLLAPRSQSYSEIGIKLQTAGMADHLAFIEEVWTTVFPEYVFSREFLDERIASFYDQEKRVEFLFSLFTIIALVIGCIGLVGLVTFMAERKTKEIGVRKVLGASLLSILGIFSKEFGQLIIVAFAVSVPISYVVMTGWLENFAFRVDVGPGVFLLTIGATTLITALTIGFRAIRAAGANPVENLRYE